MIYDYKTGKPPVQKHVDDLYAPQLSLEAAIAEGGGFEGLEQLRGQRPRLYPCLGPQRRRRGARGGDKDRAVDLAEEALTKLSALIARYADPSMPYEVKRRSAQAVPPRSTTTTTTSISPASRNG